MNVLLIAPASGGWHRIGRSRWFNGRTFRFSLLSLLTVAAETPAGHRVRIVDEQVDEIPWREDWDLVGITSMTAAEFLEKIAISGKSRKFRFSAH